MTIITVEYLKQKFSEGCTIKQIALENFMSPSTVSHTIKRYEKDGLLKRLDRAGVPIEYLEGLRDKRYSYYRIEQLTGKSYRYFKRYVDLITEKEH